VEATKQEGIASGCTSACEADSVISTQPWGKALAPGLELGPGLVTAGPAGSVVSAACVVPLLAPALALAPGSELASEPEPGPGLVVPVPEPMRASLLARLDTSRFLGRIVEDTGLLVSNRYRNRRVDRGARVRGELSHKS
jgi:hypothetical protein